MQSTHPGQGMPAIESVLDAARRAIYASATARTLPVLRKTLPIQGVRLLLLAAAALLPPAAELAISVATTDFMQDAVNSPGLTVPHRLLHACFIVLATHHVAAKFSLDADLARRIEGQFRFVFASQVSALLASTDPVVLLAAAALALAHVDGLAHVLSFTSYQVLKDGLLARVPGPLHAPTTLSLLALADPLQTWAPDMYGFVLYCAAEDLASCAANLLGATAPVLVLLAALLVPAQPVFQIAAASLLVDAFFQLVAVVVDNEPVPVLAGTLLATALFLRLATATFPPPKKTAPPSGAASTPV